MLKRTYIKEMFDVESEKAAKFWWFDGVRILALICNVVIAAIPYVALVHRHDDPPPTTHYSASMLDRPRSSVW